ncbi:hypothetical protein [Sphingomonas pokkalii]|nr:hypothetical protein [Sphingomonas pokkalii]
MRRHSGHGKPDVRGATAMMVAAAGSLRMAAYAGNERSALTGGAQAQKR